MKINPKIYEILEDIKAYPDDHITYLLSLYFGLSPVYIPSNVKANIGISGIVKFNTDGIVWKIPLFQDNTVPDAWNWVKTEYCQKFRDIGHPPHLRECETRLKKLFANNPDIRKEEVLGAVDLYLSNTDRRFVRLPHYFIEKGIGGDKTQDILTWIDKYRESIERDTSNLEDRDILL